MNPSLQPDPRVAICMATLDPQPELFLRQIESIRGQSHQNWICLISDDASDRDGFSMIEEAVGDDPRFRVERNSSRLGVYRNFERVLSSVPADVELVALADQDDRWESDKLAALANGLSGGSLLAYSDLRVVNASGEIVSSTFWTSRRNNPDDLGALLIANSITGAASLFRRDLLGYILPFPNPDEGLMHDHWIAMVAMSLGKVAYVDRPLYDYVQHPDAALGHESLRQEQKRGGGEASFMRRGYGWVLGVSAAAEELLRRGGGSIPDRKRRTLRRFARIQRSPSAWAWLFWNMLRSPITGSKTMGAERFLLAGLLWSAMPGRRKASRLPPQDA